AMPPLTVRRPLASLRLLTGSRAWLAGFLDGLAGWALYVAALKLAPISLVQAVSAGGLRLLALLQWLTPRLGPPTPPPSSATPAPAGRPRARAADGGDRRVASGGRAGRGRGRRLFEAGSARGRRARERGGHPLRDRRRRDQGGGRRGEPAVRSGRARRSRPR